MLNERAQILLKTLIERYISDGQPVGSRSLAKVSGLELSPASIRNVMADLEEMGFIASPHTSAGRVPTALGYRLFVDTLLTVQPLHATEVHQIEEQILPDDPQRVVAQASQMLSELTRFAGVVMVPKRRGSALRHVEFLQLAEKRVLLIFVTTDGDVQNRVILTDRSFGASELTTATNFINEHFSGLTFAEMQQKLAAELDQLRSDMTQLMSVVMQVSQKASADKQEEFVLSGETNLLKVDDLSSNMISLRRLFEMFEERTAILQLLDVGQRAPGVKIFIGGESGIVPLDECSVVTAPYEVDGQIVGTVGVIGPTRMAYERVISIVEITAKLLSGALSQH